VGNCGPLLELSDVQRRLNLAAGGDGGLKTIAIADIVGTLDRCCDFDREFHPMRDGLAARIQAVARAFPAGDFPPIDVVKVDRAYFVIDGHKRVAAARARGVELIDASVRRFETRHRVDAETTSADLVRLEAYERFLAESGLRLARPKAEVDTRSPESYHEMLEVVKAHGYDLTHEEGRLVSHQAVAAHWHDCDLVPTLAAAEAAGLSERLGSCPSGELYLAVHRQARTIADFDCESIEAAVAAAAERAGDSGARRRRWRPWVSRRA
jgi:ParB-like nuclease domain